MSVMNFIKNRKKENRSSLIIDNLDLDKFNNESCQPINTRMRSNSFSEISESSYGEENKSEPIIEKDIQHGSHNCNLCFNKNNIKDAFMILTCGHIFHIRCLVDNHYSEANKCGVIDEKYLNDRRCLVCNNQMETEDILYIHNKFYKNTKEYLIKQEENISIIDKQMTKLKEELRICYEYKQRLEHQREKSKQISVTINTLM